MPPSQPISEGDFQSRDTAWMRRVQQGDTEALRSIIEEYQGRVAANIARMAGAGIDPEELAHEVFVRVWKSAHRYEPTARLSTWLFAIARNLVLNEIRYKTRHPALSRDALLEDGHPEAEGPPANQSRQPDAALLEAELHEAIDQALQALPENQRTAILLRRYEDLSYEEIATILEVSVPSVKSLLFRARTALRGALSDYLA
jgi:RNA polymerase sigma-70 factor, ECF subfamily